MTRRLDVRLVETGLARSRGQARELIDQRRVLVDAVVATKASRPVDDANEVRVEGASDWVGRAAFKLIGAFDAFGHDGWEVTDRRCLDVGASTGGFTQVLLAQGASHVTSLDVGHGQLVPEIARDPRVRERSGVNVRDVSPGDLGAPFERIVADLSFISLRLVLPALRGQLAEGGQTVLLVKPQFEVGRERLGKNGLVRSSRLRQDAVADVVGAAVEAGLGLRGLVRSPVAGSAGNQEYLGWFSTADSPSATAHDVRAWVRRLDEAAH